MVAIHVVQGAIHDHYRLVIRWLRRSVGYLHEYLKESYKTLRIAAGMTICYRKL